MLALWLGMPEDREINTAVRDKQKKENQTFSERGIFYI